jgi:ribonuclease HII
MIALGIDEVGRGCWAGPLVVGAVILGRPIQGLTDSKLLNRAKREILSRAIYDKAVAIGLGWVSAAEIDKYGLTKATRIAIQRAIEQIAVGFDEIIIDGKFNYLPDDARARVVIRADLTIPSVSAASIVAKVARDNWMINVAAKQFPEYYFEQHVGYGTKLHSRALSVFGVSPIHRQSYKPIMAISQPRL